MPKTRMLVHHKQILKKFARGRVTDKQKCEALTSALAELARLVTNHLEVMYPQNDMAILERYGRAGVRQEVAVHNRPTAETYTRSLKVVLVRALTLPVSSIEIGLDDASGYDTMRSELARNVVLKAFAAVDARDFANAEAVKPYIELINQTRYFEDLVAIWPEAAEMRTQIGAPPQLPATTIDDVVRAVQADMVKRGVKVEPSTEAHP